MAWSQSPCGKGSLNCTQWDIHPCKFRTWKNSFEWQQHVDHSFLSRLSKISSTIALIWSYRRRKPHYHCYTILSHLMNHSQSTPITKLQTSMLSKILFCNPHFKCKICSNYWCLGNLDSMETLDDTAYKIYNRLWYSGITWGVRLSSIPQLWADTPQGSLYGRWPNKVAAWWLAISWITCMRSSCDFW